MRRLMPTLFASLALTGPLAHAQTALPESVVTATRIPTPQERVPASVTVITRTQIEERGYQSLAEALQEVPGLRLAPAGGLGQLTSGFLRGTGSANLLVLLDGVPVNDVSTPSGQFDFGQELLFDVDRIEVVRGPLSTLYGSAAIGGVVNLITRRAPRDRVIAPYGELAGGSNQTLRGGLGAGGTIGAFDYLVSGQSLSTRGSNATAPRFSATLNERDGFRAGYGTVRLGATPVEGTRIEALLRFRQTSFGLDSVPDDDPNYSGESRRWYGQLRGETKLLAGAWTTGLRVFATEDRRRFVNLPDSLSASAEDSLFRGSRTGVDWGNTVRLPSLGPLTDGALGFGITHTLEEARTAQLFPSGFGDFSQSVRADQHTTAGFATLQYRLLQRVDLTGGIRHDAVTGFTAETTWRLGIAVAVPEIATRLRASGGTAFRAPSLAERFGIGVFAGFVTSSGNPDLKPERSIGFELGADTDLPAFGRTDFATASWTYFQSRVRDLIVVTPDFASFTNVDRADIEGAELGLTLRPHRVLEATASWTITQAFDRATDRRLLRRPEHLVSLTTRIAPMPRVIIAPRVLFTGRANDVVYDDGGAFSPRGVTKGGTVFDVTATWQALDQVAVFLEGRNLTNSRFEPVNGFVTPGRTVLVGTRFAL